MWKGLGGVVCNHVSASIAVLADAMMPADPSKMRANSELGATAKWIEGVKKLGSSQALVKQEVKAQGKVDSNQAKDFKREQGACVAPTPTAKRVKA